MVFAKLALRRVDEYQRIDSAKVSDELETPLQEPEADVTPLLLEAEGGSDCHCDEHIDQMQQCVRLHHWKHTTSAFSRKLK
eukprot:c3069_g1_i1 orf=155-397(+)